MHIGDALEKNLINIFDAEHFVVSAHAKKALIYALNKAATNIVKVGCDWVKEKGYIDVSLLLAKIKVAHPLLVVLNF